MKEIRRDIHQLPRDMNDLTRIVEHLALEMRTDRETSQRDREIQRLRLENTLLRFERGLPPGNEPESEE